MLCICESREIGVLSESLRCTGRSRDSGNFFLTETGIEDLALFPVVLSACGRLLMVFTI